MNMNDLFYETNLFWHPKPPLMRPMPAGGEMPI
jgi:hypothetical protein